MQLQFEIEFEPSAGNCIGGKGVFCSKHLRECVASRPAMIADGAELIVGRTSLCVVTVHHAACKLLLRLKNLKWRPGLKGYRDTQFRVRIVKCACLCFGRGGEGYERHLLLRACQSTDRDL